MSASSSPDALSSLRSRVQSVEQDYVGIMKIRRILAVSDYSPSLSDECNKLVHAACYNCPVLALAPYRDWYTSVSGSGSGSGGGGGGGGAGEQASLSSLALEGKHDLLGMILELSQRVGTSLPSGLTQKHTLLLQRYETAIQNARRELNREAIKHAIMNLANYYFEVGDMQSAIVKYTDMKELCNSDKDLLFICLQIMRASTLLLSLSHTKAQYSRVRNTTMFLANNCPQTITTHVNVYMGLTYCKSQQYEQALNCFLATQVDIVAKMKDVLSLSDLALYICMLSLTCLSRKALHHNIINNSAIRSLLEYRTVTKSILNTFYTSNYVKCFEIIETIKPELMCDLFLGPHVSSILRLIRERAYIQYFRAYSSVSLHEMAHSFNMSVQQLENIVAELIGEGKIQARIDSHNKILYARHSDLRSRTYKNALLAGSNYIRHVHSALMHMSLVDNEMTLKGDREGSKRSRVEEEYDRFKDDDKVRKRDNM